VHDLPVVDAAFENDALKQIVQYYNLNPAEMEEETHRLAAKFLNEDDVITAWQILLANEVV
jgi:hypothetical protein